jgi:hypothetical protein
VTMQERWKDIGDAAKDYTTRAFMVVVDTWCNWWIVFDRQHNLYLYSLQPMEPIGWFKHLQLSLNSCLNFAPTSEVIMANLGNSRVEAKVRTPKLRHQEGLLSPTYKCQLCAPTSAAIWQKLSKLGTKLGLKLGQELEMFEPPLCSAMG